MECLLLEALRNFGQLQVIFDLLEIKRRQSMKKTMFATMAILSLFLSSCVQKEAKNEDKKEESTEQVAKESTNKSKESVVKGMDQAPTSLVGNEKPNVVFAYMLQNQINGEIEMGKVYYNEEYLVLVLSVPEKLLSAANINPKDYCKTLFDLKEEIVKQYNATQKTPSSIKLKIYDKDEKLLATEENGALVIK